jgi:hypothetical protein
VSSRVVKYRHGISAYQGLNLLGKIEMVSDRRFLRREETKSTDIIKLTMSRGNQRTYFGGKVLGKMGVFAGIHRHP